MSSMISVVVLKMIPILKIIFVNEFFDDYFSCLFVLEIDNGSSEALIQEFLVKMLNLASLRN